MVHEPGGRSFHAKAPILLLRQYDTRCCAERTMIDMQPVPIQLPLMANGSSEYRRLLIPRLLKRAIIEVNQPL